MKYAVLDISGHQLIASEGDVLSVDLIEAKEKSKQTTNKVLLIATDDNVQVGNPYVKDSLVEYEVIGHKQGKKLHVFQYKAKSRYRRKTGFRPQLTDIKITSISTDKKSSSTKTDSENSKKSTVTKKSLKK